MDLIRVLIADDHPIWRDGMSALLLSTSKIEVVGEAATSKEVIALAEQLQPDVILMDIRMDHANSNELHMNGIEATRQILRISPHINILIVTMYEDDSSIFAAIRAGARGYLLKGADQVEVLRAIEAVSNGEAIFSPFIAQHLINYFANAPRFAETKVFPELTDREREILILLAQGLGNIQIAERLVLSPKTVRNHVSNVFAKLQVSDRTQAVIRAREAGLGRDNITNRPSDTLLS